MLERNIKLEIQSQIINIRRQEKIELKIKF